MITFWTSVYLTALTQTDQRQYTGPAFNERESISTYAKRIADEALAAYEERFTAK